jgi:hypothetical protein
MQTVIESAGHLSDQMQHVIGFLELSDCPDKEHAKALAAAKRVIVALHLITTSIAAQAAQFDALAAELHQLTAELARKNRPQVKSARPV